MTSITSSRSSSPDSVTSDYSIQSHFFDHHIIRFEDFPLEIRRKVYRHLLVKRYDNDQEFGSDEDEETRITRAFDCLSIDPVWEPGVYGLNPAILRTNKKIHAEAVVVLWGGNHFAWDINGSGFSPMWHRKAMSQYPATRKVSLRCSRLITKMNLRVTVKGDRGDPYQADTIYWTTKNLDHACRKLSLNSLRILKVDFFNPFTRRQGRDEAQHCLEPLKKIRAQKFIINMWLSPSINKLRAVIEGPEDEDFLACRQEANEEVEDSLEVETAHKAYAFEDEVSVIDDEIRASVYDDHYSEDEDDDEDCGMAFEDEGAVIDDEIHNYLDTLKNACGYNLKQQKCRSKNHCSFAHICPAYNNPNPTCTGPHDHKEPDGLIHIRATCKTITAIGQSCDVEGCSFGHDNIPVRQAIHLARIHTAEVRNVIDSQTHEESLDRLTLMSPAEREAAERLKDFRKGWKADSRRKAKEDRNRRRV